MDIVEALGQFAADLKDAARTFQPKSPISTGPAPNDAMSQQASQAAAADYRLDLALQQLLAIGAEFAPDDIIGLRKRARFGDPRWLYSLYDEMMRMGPAPQVLKAREAIKGTQTVWNATPEEADEDENSTDPEDKAARLIRDVTEEAWAKWLPDIKTHLSTKFFYGLAAIQVMWRPKAIENKWSRIVDIRPIPARRFRLDPQTMRFRFLSNPFSWEGPYVDDLQKTGKLIFVEVGADVEPLDQRGLLFQCLIPWAFQQYAVRWRGKKLQTFGMPPVMVTYPSADPANKAVADQLANLLASGTRASIPEGMKAELLAAASSGSRGGDMYENAVEWCARQYDQTILGHSQVSGVQVGAGSRSSSKDAIGLFKDVTNSRAKELDNDMGQQCYGPYVAREFGQDWAENHTPTTTSTVVERDDPTELSAVLLALSQAGLGGVVAAEDSVERCTVKIAEEGEMTMAGTVKGEDADQPQQLPMLVPPGHQVVGPDGKAIPGAPPPTPLPAAAPAQPQPPQLAAAKKPPQLPSPGQEPPNAIQPAQVPPAQVPVRKDRVPVPISRRGGEFAAISDVQSVARYVLRRRRGRKAIQEFYTRRERFAAAALVGGHPRITITSFGYEHGAPTDTAMNVDVRSMSGGPYDVARTGKDSEVRAALEAHPMTGAIYGGVKSRVQQAIKAADVTGDPDVRIGVGCEHGKHRSVYIADRLGQDLLRDGHDVVVEHRDATDADASGERGIGNVVDFPGEKFRADDPRVDVRVTALPSGKVFFSESQARDAGGRWTSGSEAEQASTATGHANATAFHESRAIVAPDPESQIAHRRAADAHRSAEEAHTSASPNYGATARASAHAREASRVANKKFGAEQFYSEAQVRDSGGRWTAGESEAGSYAENAHSVGEHAIASAYHHDAASAMLRKEPGDAATIRRGPSKAWEEAALAHSRAGALHGSAARGDHAASMHARDASHDAHEMAAEALKQPRWADLPRVRHERHAALTDEEEQQLAAATERVALVPVKTHVVAQAHARLAVAMRQRLAKQYAAALDEAKTKLAAGGEK